MATKSIRKLSFQDAQAMWPGVTLNKNEGMQFQIDTLPDTILKYGKAESHIHENYDLLPRRGRVDIAPKKQNFSVERVDPLAATKFDQGKPDWSLVPFEALEGMVKVLEFGAKKYSRNNWKKGGGFLYTRVLGSCFRHLFAFLRGEDVDPESGLSHIYHAQCNLLFLAYYLTNEKEFNKDDRGE